MAVLAAVLDGRDLSALGVDGAEESEMSEHASFCHFIM